MTSLVWPFFSLSLKNFFTRIGLVQICFVKLFVCLTERNIFSVRIHDINVYKDTCLQGFNTFFIQFHEKKHPVYLTNVNSAWIVYEYDFIICTVHSYMQKVYPSMGYYNGWSCTIFYLKSILSWIWDLHRCVTIDDIWTFSVLICIYLLRQPNLHPILTSWRVCEVPSFKSCSGLCLLVLSQTRIFFFWDFQFSRGFRRF